MPSYSWTMKLRIPTMARQGIPGWAALKASSMARTASPMTVRPYRVASVRCDPSQGHHILLGVVGEKGAAFAGGIAVKIGGVVVGRVSNIYVDPEKLVPVVEMEIQQKYNMLSSESKASILTAGLIGEQYIGITPGFYDEDMGTTYLKDGDRINDTGSAVVLEDLIGKFLYSVNKSDSSSGASSSGDTEHVQ